MTTTARLVLQDVEHAIGMHSSDLSAEEFRISWFSIIGLLRAVGHVLDKVDAPTSPEMRQAVSDHWVQLKATKPEPHIFWGFIDSERNRFLKSYEHSVNRGFDLPVRTSTGALTNATTRIVTSRSHGIDTRGSSVRLTSFLDGGAFAGKDELDVAKQSVNWWRRYLDSIDRQMSRKVDES